MGRIWFTADTHFQHANIIKYCGRPFTSAEEMDETMITNWNAVVQPRDIVYHLGDFVFCRKTEVVEAYIRRLNGHINLVWGNHDKHVVKRAQGFAGQSQYREIKIEGQSITLMHYAMRVWNKSHHGSWQLFGHTHDELPEEEHQLQTDVGMDARGFCPMSFEQVKELMDKRRPAFDAWNPPKDRD